ncbi:MAG: OmpA family protein [Bacteroidales bacterium]|jgi:outer membrane protein OmpA-like peptidoglycan-associated protein/tetratricopeptide (TPR) repeat protein|nr:OmpA family protein [Bacteroidales bacterium]MDD2205096.1 OmpA family protein [Bacteroidales bacterium]
MSCLHKILLAVALLVLSCSTIYAQKMPKKIIRIYEQARNEYNMKNYSKALDDINACLEKAPDFRDAYILKGEICIEVDEFCEAANSYEKAMTIEDKSYEMLDMKIGMLYFSCGNFQKSKEIISKYLSKYHLSNSNLKFADSILKICDYAIDLIEHPLDIQLKSVGKQVNTDADEFVNTISASANQLIFTRRIEKIVSFNDMSFNEVSETAYMANELFTADSLMWDSIIEVDKLLKGVGAAINISPDGKYMFFALCNDENGFGSCDLYRSRNINGQWQKPENLGDVVNTKYWESQPCMSSDNKTLFFVSNRPGGYGKSDIWYTRIDEDGKFSMPQNAGAKINTAGEETTPFIHFDAYTLYFASNGHPGLGGFDLFKVDMRNYVNDEVTNLGYPVNNAGDQQCFVITPDAKTAYISSSTGSKTNNFDIFSFEVPEAIRPISTNCIYGKVIDAYTRQPLQAVVNLLSKDVDTLLLISAAADTDGKFVLCLKENIDFGITAYCKGYLPYSEINVSFTDDEKIKNIELFPIEIGKDFVAKNIVFAYNSYELVESSYYELDVLALMMAQNPQMCFEIRGHTDNIGTQQYNKELSLKRAEVVYNYLISKSISDKRLKYVGCGYDFPIDTNDTEEGRAVNRRTEFRIIK